MPTVIRIRSVLILLWWLGMAGMAGAHPLGNFTINHFSRITVGTTRVDVRYVVDMAEIPALQEITGIDSAGQPSTMALAAYGERMAQRYAQALALTVDDARVTIRPRTTTVTTPAGSGGLRTLRLETDLTGDLPDASAPTPRRLGYVDGNHPDRQGWHELVVTAAPGLVIFDSTAYGSAATDELRDYPDASAAAPLDERTATFSVAAGALPQHAAPLRQRGGAAAGAGRDRLADLIAVTELTPGGAILGVLIAALLGGLHALSPGHGKTIVGAYLVGSRGTARHAAFLGLTVTITHTLGVFALGVATLFASPYILPERLLPLLSLISGAIVLALGASLLVRRARGVFRIAHHHGGEPHDDDHHHDHGHGHGHHHHGFAESADGRITWRSLLALGVSGGIVPCPSALVVLLAAIALHRIAYGLLLIVGFSAGLAAVLTAVGLAFVYGGGLLRNPLGGRLMRILPIASAAVITAVGAVLCWQALRATGLDPQRLFAASPIVPALPLLGLGLLYGLTHALDADHVAAVSAIVSERRSVWSSAAVGALWGVGHTAALLAAGIVVIILHVEIGERLAQQLELGVAVMLVGLGVSALRAVWTRPRHAHLHRHGNYVHAHGHPHRIGVRPLLVGMVHGLAGSAALMLLVLSTIPSPPVAFAYILVFGIGSIGGMLAVSALLSLPLHLTTQRFARADVALRAAAALFSVGIGIGMAYDIGAGLMQAA